MPKEKIRIIGVNELVEILEKHFNKEFILQEVEVGSGGTDRIQIGIGGVCNLHLEIQRAL